MDYVRTILFGQSRGETLASYWKNIIRTMQPLIYASE